MELAFRKYGSGQPLLILHGLFGQSDNWNTLAKKYAEEGFEVYAIDQRNHGLSPHSEIWTYESMAEDLHELIRNQKLSRPVLMGHSMGGKTVMFFEMMFPQLAEKIVVADMAPHAYPAHHTEVISALQSVNFAQITSRKEAEEQMSKYNLDFGTKQFLLKNLYWKDEAAKRLDWRFNLKVIADQYHNMSVEIPDGKSTVPSLFARGGKSDYITERSEQQIKSLFVNAAIETVEGAGHWLHAEKPAEYFDLTMKFMRG